MRAGLAAVLVAAAAALAACGPSRLPAVPLAEETRANVLDIPRERVVLGTEQAKVAMAAEVERSLERERKASGGRLSPTSNYLALSGGGDDGAFGAGLLVGWTAAGTRPKFKLVTGVSTGSLSAPFAFLGPEYDPALRAIYTDVTQKDIFAKRPIVAAVTEDAMTDSAPLHRMIEKYVDQALLRRIAAEYAKGRLLLILSTNLDAGRPVIWNIGAIAESGRPDALVLVQRVLLASASIPGVFPPVMFDVAVDGRRFQEMHVDGGAMAQLFIYPPGARPGSKRHHVAYVIRNGRFAPTWSQVDRQTLPIAMRAVSTLTAGSGIGDVYMAYALARRDHVDFNLASIGDDFTKPYQQPFEPSYMGALFDYAYQKTLHGYPWQKAPPGYQ